MADVRSDGELDPFRHPFRHLFIVSALVFLSFAVCELTHWLDPAHWAIKTRPDVHMIFLPHGMLVLLAWFYGWAVVPLVLPSFLIAVALLIGPEFMTPTSALLTVSRILAVMLTFELLRQICCDVRDDKGRRGLIELFVAGLLSSMAFNVLRVSYGHCCEVMSLSEKAIAYAVAVGADLVGMMIVMVGAMLVFRFLRQA